MKSTFNVNTSTSNYNFGNTVRDDVLQYQIDNDVAQKITAERIEEGELAGQVLIKLSSKNDNELYSAHFETGKDPEPLNWIISVKGQEDPSWNSPKAKAAATWNVPDSAILDWIGNI